MGRVEETSLWESFKGFFNMSPELKSAEGGPSTPQIDNKPTIFDTMADLATDEACMLASEKESCQRVRDFFRTAFADQMKSGQTLYTFDLSTDKGAPMGLLAKGFAAHEIPVCEVPANMQLMARFKEDGWELSQFAGKSRVTRVFIPPQS